MTKADKPTSPWREAPYTTLPNSYLLRLAGSNLAGRAICAMLVILTETRGAPGQGKGYGRDSAPVSAADVAEGMGCSTSTARRAVVELVEAGLVHISQPASGKRGHTLTPLLTPRRKLEPVPEPVVDEAEREAGRAISQGWLDEVKRRDREAVLRKARGESA